MKKFILKIIVFSILITGIILFMLSRYGGYVDYFYIKFTSPKQHSLIIGDSRSFQGIQPSVINDNLKNQFELPMYNYSFTLAQTAYGESLLNSIKLKVDENTKNGLFILSVQPWLLAKREKDDFENGVYFEDDCPPNNMRFASMNPNIEYFFKNYSFFHFKAAFRKNSIVHNDGWLEESNLTKDTVTLNLWKKKQIGLYKGFINKWEKSQYRLDKLSETVAFLKKHGTVIIIRMPNSKPILALENKFWKDFDSNVIQIAAKNKVKYINYTQIDNPFYSYDGVHLDKHGGYQFTKSLCDSIKNLKSN